MRTLLFVYVQTLDLNIYNYMYITFNLRFFNHYNFIIAITIPAKLVKTLAIPITSTGDITLFFEGFSGITI